MMNGEGRARKQDKSPEVRGRTQGERNRERKKGGRDVDDV